MLLEPIALKVTSERLLSPVWVYINPPAIAYIRGFDDHTAEVVLVSGEVLLSDKSVEELNLKIWPGEDYDEE